MPDFEHLPDDATRLTSAGLRSHFTGMSRDPTVIGWLGRYALLVLLLGGGTVLAGLLVPVLYQFMN
ncbi:hypothetical protein [Massilia consociata]|uniref:ABC transporter ATP-binding protein n=1 Tax=Massilia consociata TaxID=760117 RepID=A0ABV6FDE4_9BURK